MKNVFLITIKELKDYFTSVIAYIVIIIFSISLSLIFLKDFFNDGEASLKKLFLALPVIL